MDARRKLQGSEEKHEPASGNHDDPRACAEMVERELRVRYSAPLSRRFISHSANFSPPLAPLSERNLRLRPPQTCGSTPATWCRL